jgi:DNA-binding response OmpR family regulator
MVILDLRLPDLYGTEVLTRIKAQCRPETAVIILTGHGTEKDREQCMARGAHSFMNKPLDIDRLVAIMAQIRGTIVMTKSTKRFRGIHVAPVSPRTMTSI